MSEIVDLAEQRARRAQRAQPAGERRWVIGFRFCRSIAAGDPYDAPDDAGRIEDVRQLSFDFSRDDAIDARLRAAYALYAAACERECDLLAELVALRHGFDPDPESPA